MDNNQICIRLKFIIFVFFVLNDKIILNASPIENSTGINCVKHTLLFKISHQAAYQIMWFLLFLNLNIYYINVWNASVLCCDVQRWNKTLFSCLTASFLFFVWIRNEYSVLCACMCVREMWLHMRIIINRPLLHTLFSERLWTS